MDSTDLRSLIAIFDRILSRIIPYHLASKRLMLITFDTGTGTDRLLKKEDRSEVGVCVPDTVSISIFHLHSSGEVI